MEKIKQLKLHWVAISEAKSILNAYANELVSAKVFVDNNIYISFYKESLDDIKILKL